MQTMRTDNDDLRRESASRLDTADSMKRECATVRKALRKYLQGHVFMLQKIRIRRHLKSCAVCSSEYQALAMEMKTIVLLKEINPHEGLMQYWKAGVAGAAKLKLLLYRPLWMAAIAGVLVLVYVNVTARRGDPEIENLENSLPPLSESAPAAVSSPTATVFSPPLLASAGQAAAVAPSARKAVHEAPAVEPLLITITPENEQTAVRRINEIMHGHASLRRLHLSDAVKEVSGSLSSGELLTFFNRIASAGKVSYSRKRFDSFPADQLIPFVMKLRPASGAVAAQPAAPVEPKAYRPAETTVQPAPESAPTTSP